MQSLIPNGSLLATIKRDWKNPPNLVTGLRMIGTLGIPPLALARSDKKRWAGLALFVLLAATDKLDGWMAKKIYGSTELGKMLDPLVDKELILTTLGVILKDARRQRDTTMMTALVLAIPTLLVREVAVLHIKAVTQRETQTVDSAIQSGRISMVAQSVAVGALLIPSKTPTIRRAKFGLLSVAVGASLYSWWDYHRKYRAHS